MASPYLHPQFAVAAPNYNQNFSFYSVQQPNVMQPHVMQPASSLNMQGQQGYRTANGSWDYRNYYGTGNNSSEDATGGAGGFNWWES
jgi:hypothetical protein